VNAEREREQASGVDREQEHDGGLFAHQAVLLAIDCWEHAYFRDYWTKKDDYVDGVLRHLDWAAVQARLDRASRPMATA